MSAPAGARTPKLKSGAHVRVYMDPFGRARLEGTAELVRYLRSPVGRFPAQVWRVRFLTLRRLDGSDIVAADEPFNPVRVVFPEDVIPAGGGRGAAPEATPAERAGL